MLFRLGFALEFCRVLSIAAFLWFGIHSVFFNGMAEEFERFGLEPYRRIVGVFEIVGALGLLLSFKKWSVGAAAAIGLSLLMLAGVIVRVRVQDPLIQILPATLFMLMNFYLGYRIFRRPRASLSAKIGARHHV
ncbi:MAG: putative membrane protein YphA (DoxX/SURF4 family) [Planctomycetota bacterium]|jgi:uncharacterized membrane protein YphA (DoxX/SURF4 family)